MEPGDSPSSDEDTRRVPQYYKEAYVVSTDIKHIKLDTLPKTTARAKKKVGSNTSRKNADVPSTSKRPVSKKKPLQISETDEPKLIAKRNKRPAKTPEKGLQSRRSRGKKRTCTEQCENPSDAKKPNTLDKGTNDVETQVLCTGSRILQDDLLPDEEPPRIIPMEEIDDYMFEDDDPNSGVHGFTFVRDKEEEEEYPSWTEKYRPKTVREHAGQHGGMENIRTWLKENRERKHMTRMALVIVGPPGVGKTSAVNAVAESEGYDVLEINPLTPLVDVKTSKIKTRAPDVVLDLVIPAMVKRKGDRPHIVLLDEAENMASQKSYRYLWKPPGRGKSTKSHLQGILKPRKPHASPEKKQKNIGEGVCVWVDEEEPSWPAPLIMTVNNWHDEKLTELRKGNIGGKKFGYCEVVYFNRIPPNVIAHRLLKICDAEKIKCISNTVLEKIGRASCGDMRRAVMILQESCKGLGGRFLSMADVDKTCAYFSGNVGFFLEKVKNNPQMYVDGPSKYRTDAREHVKEKVKEIREEFEYEPDDGIQNLVKKVLTENISLEDTIRILNQKDSYLLGTMLYINYLPVLEINDSERHPFLPKREFDSLQKSIDIKKNLEEDPDPQDPVKRERLCHLLGERYVPIDGPVVIDGKKLKGCVEETDTLDAMCSMYEYMSAGDVFEKVGGWKNEMRLGEFSDIMCRAAPCVLSRIPGKKNAWRKEKWGDVWEEYRKEAARYNHLKAAVNTRINAESAFGVDSEVHATSHLWVEKIKSVWDDLEKLKQMTWDMDRHYFSVFSGIDQNIEKDIGTFLDVLKAMGKESAIDVTWNAKEATRDAILWLLEYEGFSVEDAKLCIDVIEATSSDIEEESTSRIKVNENRLSMIHDCISEEMQRQKSLITFDYTQTYMKIFQHALKEQNEKEKLKTPTILDSVQLHDKDLAYYKRRLVERLVCLGWTSELVKSIRKLYTILDEKPLLGDIDKKKSSYKEIKADMTTRIEYCQNILGKKHTRFVTHNSKFYTLAQRFRCIFCNMQNDDPDT